MVSRTYSAGLVGVEGHVVTVEADVGLGLPCLTIVGRASGALNEARERVRNALAHCGFPIRARRQVVNLAPAELRKDSPGIDLAVACALLVSHEVIEASAVEDLLFWGELGLDGTLRPVAGALVVADLARQVGKARIVVAPGNVAEARLIPGLEVIGAPSLAALVAHLRKEVELPACGAVEPAGELAADEGEPDMSDVRGLVVPRLAVEVMVAGGHNLLLHGPPGIGKTMLARRARGLFPILDRESALEVTKIHDVARRHLMGKLIDRAPFRAPHHTVSAAGLLGGGTPLRPGEVSLAHRGLLFLDELPEFPRSCIEGLREPLEEGEVTVVRSQYAATLPARFQLMAAMNPCPCGYLGHPERACVCSVQAVHRYQQRVSGPFMDRMDLVVPVLPSEGGAIADAPPGERSAEIRGRVARARDRQGRRLAGTPWRTNADIPARDDAIERLCPLTADAGRLLRGLTQARQLSPRTQNRLRRVALTLRDLREADELDAPIELRFVAEAAHLRRPPDPSAA